jgi:FtsP/CotA-like multicopper oxidase with cupredoxin domain
VSIDRRKLLQWLGLGGGAGLLGGGLVYSQQSQGGETPNAGMPMGPRGLGGRYGTMSDPPDGLGPRALDDRTVPPPYRAAKPGSVRSVSLRAMETTLEVGKGAVTQGLCYEGTSPGPIIRATQGEILDITLLNSTTHPHTIHFHGSFDPSEDGWEPVKPEGTRTYRVATDTIGLHPYHCHAPPYAWHIAKGLYGTMIVDPPGGRPPAHEHVLVLGGWDLDDDGKNELYTWNGVAGFYHRFPLKVPVGDLVRLYVVNLVEYDPMVTFHLHAQTFDIFRTGTSLQPDDHSDVISLGPTERAILEFRLPHRGRYMFHPHQGHMVEGGAMGWIVAI